MPFDGASSNQGNYVGFMLYSPLGKLNQFSFILEFEYSTNNINDFKDLLVGIKQRLNIICKHLTTFDDSQFIVDLMKKKYSPSDKLIKRYTHTSWPKKFQIYFF